jgi:threonine synthase
MIIIQYRLTMSPSQFKKQYLANWKETPLVSVGGIWFKIEGNNPTGSIKSRGLAWQIYYLLVERTNEAVISSSGNAAIAASYYANFSGIKLHTFVPKSIPEDKLSRLREFNLNVNIVDHPSIEAEKFAKQNQIRLIRQSIDPHARDGFMLLANEINQQLIKENQKIHDFNIFFPVSSGTTTSGFYLGLSHYNLQAPAIHVVQSEAVNLIASQFDHKYVQMARSIAQGIIATQKQNTYYEDTMNAVLQTQGYGWIVSDQKIKNALDWLNMNRINASIEGALALAGYFKAREEKFNLRAESMIILT